MEWSGDYPVEWQVRAVGAIFFVLAGGNIATTMMVMQKKNAKRATET
jgi:hypothetical protein